MGRGEGEEVCEVIKSDSITVDSKKVFLYFSLCIFNSELLVCCNDILSVVSVDHPLSSGVRRILIVWIARSVISSILRLQQAVCYMIVKEIFC